MRPSAKLERDQIDIRKLHCMIAMTLLQPWRDISTICSTNISWEIMFELFHATADRRTRLFVENIQFYYKMLSTSYSSYETVKDSYFYQTLKELSFIRKL